MDDTPFTCKNCGGDLAFDPGTFKKYTRMAGHTQNPLLRYGKTISEE